MMEAISLLDDLDGVWASIVADAEAKEYGKNVLAETGNIVQVNHALGRQARLLVDLRKHTKHEVIQFHLLCACWFHILVLVRLLLTFCFQLTMQTVAIKSPLVEAIDQLTFEVRY